MLLHFHIKHSTTMSCYLTVKYTHTNSFRMKMSQLHTFMSLHCEKKKKGKTFVHVSVWECDMVFLWPFISSWHHPTQTNTCLQICTYTYVHCQVINSSSVLAVGMDWGWTLNKSSTTQWWILHIIADFFSTLRHSSLSCLSSVHSSII